MDMCDSVSKGQCTSCAASYCEHCLVSHECVKGPRLARFRIISVNDVYTVFLAQLVEKNLVCRWRVLQKSMMSFDRSAEV